MVQERSISDLLQRVVDVHPRLSRYQDMAGQLDQYLLAFRDPDAQSGSVSYETIDESQAKEAQTLGSWEGKTVRTSAPEFVLREQAKGSGPAALFRRHWMWLLLLLVVLAMVLSRVLGD